jgi:hypothetical protein
MDAKTLDWAIEICDLEINIINGNLISGVEFREDTRRLMEARRSGVELVRLALAAQKEKIE